MSALVCDGVAEWLGTSGSAVDESDLLAVGIGGEVCDFCAGEKFSGEVCVGGAVRGVGDFVV